METLDPNVVDDVQLLLVARASIFSLLFLVLGIVALRTNFDQRLAVNTAGIISLALFVVNTALALKWLTLFYF